MGLTAIMFLGMILGAFLIAKGLKNKKINMLLLVHCHF